MQIIMDHCEQDDVSGVAECLGMATSSGRKDMVQKLLSPCLRRAAMHGSTKVISYLIERGADVTEIGGSLLSATGTPPTRETLKVLVANGRDINRCLIRKDAPVLWDLLEDIHLVQWCLDHGASVDPPDNTPPEFIG